ncbi:DUF1850 domain-containing protein [Marinobacterium maritimum]|uniref:DUF1850 domain-containing protein n=1 Tax=Marinobacterium maritimum TaxID=500162 RepID=A0ABP3TGI3_9GAMM
MSLLCIGLLAAAVEIQCVETDDFTLRWQHSVEHSGWYEEYQLSGQQLQLVESAVQQSGAGMEPAPDARLIDGWWVSRPATPLSVPELVLPDSAFTGPMHLCLQETCQPLRSWLTGHENSTAPVRLFAGEQPLSQDDH